MSETDEGVPDDERVVADFRGEFYVSDMARDGPIRGRIVMSQRRLVLVGASRRETVPTTAVCDVAVGQVPPRLQSFFGNAVTVGYETGDGRRRAVVEGDADTVEKFVTVLFKTQLTGREATVEHPARRGGRVVDAPARRARLAPGDRHLAFHGPDVEFAVDLATVTGVDRERRTLDGHARPALVVRHVPRSTTLVSVVALPSDRLATILWRYLRLEYADRRETLSECSLSTADLEVLVALYAGEGAIDPVDVVTTEPGRTPEVLSALREAGLVTDGESGTSLTQTGRIAVAERIETVDR